MLILSRKEGEAITIGDNIKINFIELTKSSVKIGIDAPDDVIILRSELEKAVKQSNKDANKEVPEDVLKSLRDRLKVD